MERAIRARKSCPELGRGEVTALESDVDAVFAHACSLESGTVVAVHNLAGRAVQVAIDLSGFAGDRLVDVLGDEELAWEPKLELDLGRYGHCWLRVVREA